MAPRKKKVAAQKFESFTLTDTAIQLLLQDNAAIQAAQDQYKKTLVTLAAGAGVPEGVAITNVDLEGKKVFYRVAPKTPLAVVGDGPKE